MSLVTLTLILSGLGIVVTGALALMFLVSPDTGMRYTSHQFSELPKVMADRYIALTALAAGATFYGDLKVIAFLFAVFAFLGFADAWIYHRHGTPILKHVAAGALATIVVVVALIAQSSTGVAA